MYVTGVQFETGVVRYMREDMLPKVDGWRKIAFGAAMNLVEGSNLSEKILNNAAFSVLNLKDSENRIDLDRLKQAVCDSMGQQKLQIDIPAIGSFKFSQADVQRLYNTITNVEEE